MSTLWLIFFAVTGIALLYIGIALYRMYKADPSENVSMMGQGKAGLASCAKQIKKLITHQNCDR